MMKQLFTTLFSFAAAAILQTASAQMAARETGSEVKFKIKNFGINVNGTFKDIKGTINFNPQILPSASFDVSVDANTVNTGMKGRDNHLRKEDYFDVAKYPRITIKSTKITATNKAGYYYFFGKLTIKDVTKDISFPFTATPNEGGYLFQGDFKLNRRDYGVGGSSISMSDNLTVTLSVYAK
jgi:polyisoprenoid-binding protein YceI